MRLSSAAILSSLAMLFVAGCASSDAGVDTSELARLVGNEDSVRIDAQLLGTQLSAGANIAIRFEVENMRSESIAFADIKPESSYDPETGVITVLLGSEVPGNELIPRLQMVRSGEKRVFNVGVGLGSSRMRAGPGPRLIRLRLAWLEDVEPFSELIGMKEVAWYNPERADELFMPWVENLRFVTTNEVPLDWNRANVPQTRRPRGF